MYVGPVWIRIHNIDKKDSIIQAVMEMMGKTFHSKIIRELDKESLYSTHRNILVFGWKVVFLTVMF